MGSRGGGGQGVCRVQGVMGSRDGGGQEGGSSKGVVGSKSRSTQMKSTWTKPT